MRPAAWRIGLFTLAGLATFALVVSLVAGRWLAASEPATMRFETSVYGLQVGAPVVFRGVRVGQVTAIRLAPAGDAGPTMPVTVELDRALLRDLLGPDAPAGPAVPLLVARGLVARLATQSLLTGLLYVDLDLVPGRQPPAGAAAPAGGQAATIPTQPTQLQSLQAQLADLDLARIGRDLADVAAAARRLLADPQADGLLGRLASAAGAVESTARRLERETGPLARGGTRLVDDAGHAIAEVSRAAAQVSGAALQLRDLAAAGAPAADAMRRAADDLGRAAQALRDTAADGSPVREQLDRALRDVSNAARAMRELSEQFREHPDAWWRGRIQVPRRSDE